MEGYQYSLAPEVVHYDNGLEVAPIESVHPAPAQYPYPDPSTNAPEPVQYNAFPGDGSSKEAASSTPGSDRANSGTHFLNNGDNESVFEPLYRRRLGRLRIYVWVLLALLLLAIIIAIVVPVVVLKNKHNSPPPPAQQSFGPKAAFNQTGMANVNLQSSQGPVTYSQTTNGTIMEYFWEPNTLTNNSWTPVNGSVVANDAKPGFPMGAVTYTVDNDVERRHFFYFSQNGELNDLTLDVTGTNPTWQKGLLAANFTGASNTAFRWLSSTSNNLGFAVCVNENGYGNGTSIRLFVGVEYLDGSGSYVQQIGTEFANYGESLLWAVQEKFTSADATAGLACTVPMQEQYLYLYYVNTTSNQIQQDYASYTNNSGNPEEWNHNSYTYQGPAPVSNTPIAAANSGSWTDFVMYQTSANTVRDLEINLDATPVALQQYNDLNLPNLDQGSKLAAQLVANASSLPPEVLMYYQSTDHEIVAVSSAPVGGSPSSVNATLNIASA